MLTNPIMDKLTAMRLTGMAKALAEQMEMRDLDALTFDERLGLMVDREISQREDRRLGQTAVSMQHLCGPPRGT